MMEPMIPDRELKAEDLYGLPDDGKLYELVEGRLVSEPLPGARHGRVTVRVAVLVGEFLRSHPLGVLFGNDTGFVLARSPDTVRGPDVAFVTKERFEEVGDVPTHFPGPPDMAIEVLSPDNRAGDAESNRGNGEHAVRELERSREVRADVLGLGR